MIRIPVLGLLGALLLSSVSFAEVTPEIEPNGWTVWTPLGGYITSDPAACTYGNWTYVVAKGGDNYLWYRKRSLSTGIWADWRRIPSTLKFEGSPAINCRPSTNGLAAVELAAVATDHRLWAVDGVGDSWGSWYLIAGNVDPGTGPATASSPVANQRHYFIRGTDGSVFWRYFSSGGNSNWLQLSSPMSADPAATMQNSGHMDLIVRALDGTLFHRFWENGAWYNFSRISPEVVTSSPDIVSRGLGSLDLFVRGSGNVLLHNQWINGVWGNWEWLGGAVTSGPGATTYANNSRIFVFVRWSDGSLYYRAWAAP